MPTSPCNQSEDSSEGSEDDNLEEPSLGLLGGSRKQGIRAKRSSIDPWGSRFGGAASSFVADTELAIRSAIMCVVFVSPLMLPVGDLPISHSVHRMIKNLGIAQNGAMYFIFTIWKSVGSTLDLFRQNIIGLTIFALHHYAVHFLLHHLGMNIEVNAPGLSFSACTIWLEGAVFIFVTLWLNFNPNVALWVVSLFVWAWMDDLEPGREGQSLCTVLQNYVGMLLGGVLALLATLLPYPLMAIWKARDAAQDVLAGLGSSWEGFQDSFQHEDALVRMRFVLRGLRQVHGQLAALEGLLAEARWEVYFNCRWKWSHRAIARCLPHMKRADDQLACAVLACLEIPPGLQHAAAGHLALAVRGPLEECAAATSGLLAMIAQAIDRGSMSEEDGEAMDEAVGRVETAGEALQAARRRGAGAEGGALDEGAMGVAVCCLELAAFAEGTADVAKDFAADAGGESPLPPMEGVFEGAGGTFDRQVLYDPQHLRWVLRFLVLIVVAQVIGYNGAGRLIPPFSVYISNVISVMLNQRGPGSELLKDFARIQGMIMGTVGGQFINAFFGGCGAEKEAIMLSMLLVWMAFSFYLVFHSQEYSNMYFGYMLAEFGDFEMVVPCKKLTYDPDAMFARVSCLIISLVLLMLVSAVIRQPRASQVAGSALSGAFHDCRAALEALFDPEVAGVGVDLGAIDGALAKAATYGAEATKELQTWGPPWDQTRFERTMLATQSLRTGVASLTRAAQLGAGGASRKSRFFVQFTGLADFRSLWAMQQQQLRLIDKMLAEIYQEGCGEPSPATLGRLMETGAHAAGWEEARGKLLARATQIASQDDRDLFAEESEQVEMVLAVDRLLRGKLSDLRDISMQS